MINQNRGLKYLIEYSAVHWYLCILPTIPKQPLPALFYCLSFHTVSVTVQLFGHQNAQTAAFSSTSKPLCYLLSASCSFFITPTEVRRRGSSRGRGVLPLYGSELISLLSILSLGQHVQENQGKDFDCQQEDILELMNTFFQKTKPSIAHSQSLWHRSPLFTVSQLQLPYADALQWTAPSVITKFIVKKMQVSK